MTKVKGEMQESNLKLLLFEARVFQILWQRVTPLTVGWFAGRTWAITMKGTPNCASVILEYL